MNFGNLTSTFNLRRMRFFSELLHRWIYVIFLKGSINRSLKFSQSFKEYPWMRHYHLYHLPCNLSYYSMEIGESWSPLKIVSTIFYHYIFNFLSFIWLIFASFRIRHNRRSTYQKLDHTTSQSSESQELYTLWFQHEGTSTSYWHLAELWFC